MAEMAYKVQVWSYVFPFLEVSFGQRNNDNQKRGFQNWPDKWEMCVSFLFPPFYTNLLEFETKKAAPAT